MEIRSNGRGTAVIATVPLAESGEAEANQSVASPYVGRPQWTPNGRKQVSTIC